jgi:hypothetical protein
MLRSFQNGSLVLAVVAALFVGCADSQNGDGSAPVGTTDTQADAILTSVNTHCPIMGSEVTDDGGRVEWNGKTVGFCCPQCIDGWNELSEEEKEAKLMAAGKGAEHAEDGHDHDHADAAETEAG